MAMPRDLAAILRNDFVAFSQRAFPDFSGGESYMPNWHIEAIAWQLKRMEQREITRSLITLPPRSLKSFMISVAWPAWLMGHDPTCKVIGVTYSSELSNNLARGQMRIMQAPWYREVFPETVISPKRMAVHDFETTAGGGRLSTSLGGVLTGRGGDVIILDDPIKAADAASITMREGAIDWMLNTLFSRLNKPSQGLILGVMQRLHEYDPVGYLLERDWPELRLAAIAPEDERIPLSAKRFHFRKEGTPLHPERVSLADLERTKAEMNPNHFQAQYQQDPLPATGNMVERKWLKRYAGLLKRLPGDKVIQSWDTASEENLAADYSVCITALVRGQNVYILDVFRERLKYPQLREQMLRLAKTWRAETILVEYASSGRQLVQSLGDDQRLGPATVLAVRPRESKEVRMDGQTDRIAGGQLLLPEDAPWLTEFEKEILGFPNGRYADQVDALSQLLRWTRHNMLTDDPGGCPEESDTIAPWDDDDEYSTGMAVYDIDDYINAFVEAAMEEEDGGYHCPHPPPA